MGKSRRYAKYFPGNRLISMDLCRVEKPEVAVQLFLSNRSDIYRFGKTFEDEKRLII